MNRRKKLAELRAKRANLLKEARSLEEALDVPADELQAKQEAIIAEIEKIDASIRYLLKLLNLEEEAKELQSEVTDEAAEETSEPVVAPSEEPRSRAKDKSLEIRSAFREWLFNPRNVRAEEVLRTETRGAPTPVTPQSGAALIPTYVLNEITSKINQTVWLRQLANVKTIRGQTNVPVASGAVAFDVVPPGGEYPQVKVDFEGPMLRVLKIGGIASFLVETLKLAVEDEAFNFEDEFVAVVVEALRDAEERVFLTGTGPYSPRGLIPSTPVRVNVSGAWGVEDIIALQESIPEHHQANAVWIMSQTTRGRLRALEGQGGLLWTPNLQGKPADLLGKPVYVSPYVDDNTIWYGDPKEFVIGDRGAMEIFPMNERYGEQGIHAFRLTSFTDSAVRNENAMGVAKLS